MAFCRTTTLQKDHKLALTFVGKLSVIFFLSLENGTADHFTVSLYTHLQFMNGTGLGLVLSTGQIKWTCSS